LCGKRAGLCLKFLRTASSRFFNITDSEKTKIKIKELLVLVISDTLKNLQCYKRTGGFLSPVVIFMPQKF
jgi:hypothetical protein